MTIHQLVQNTALQPEDIERLVAAYQQTLRALGLEERDDPLTRAIANEIIQIGQKFQNSLSGRSAISLIDNCAPPDV